MSEQTPNFIAPKNVIIIGAGVVGLGIAWRLAQRGVEVTVFDKGGAGAGASHAAAGMLACRFRKPHPLDSRSPANQNMIA